MKRLTQFDFHHTLAQQRGTSIVLFTKPGCSSCRHWHGLLETFVQSSSVGAFAVDAEEDAALAREFEVFHLPALFLYRDGRFHCALQCEARLPALVTAIATALALPAQEPP